MPLTNAAYFNAARLGNVVENWLVEIDNSAGGTLRLAFRDTYVGGNLYLGALLNEPSVRASIDLAESKAGTGNLSLEVHNTTTAGALLAESLVFGGTKYINRAVRVYSQLNEETTLANCLHLYTGRLMSVEHDVGEIRMVVEEARPWDFIKIPQDRTTSRNRLFPIVYGDYTGNSSTPSYRAFCASSALYPVQVDQRSPQAFVCLMPRSYVSGAGLHIYDETSDSFVPLVDDTESVYDVTFSSVGGNCTKAHAELWHGWYLKGTEPGAGDGTTVTFSNTRNAWDVPHANDTSASAATETLNVTSVSGDSGAMFIGIPRPEHPIKGSSTMTATVYWSAVKTGAGTPSGSPSSNITLSAPFGVSGTAATSALNWGAGVQSAAGSWTITGDCPGYLKIAVSANNTGGTGNAAIAISVWDVTISYETQVDVTDDPQAVATASNAVKWLYCGANGLQDYDRSGGGTDYWINGNGTPSEITEIHQAHRDLVHRFTSYQGDPTGWSDLDTARSGWTIRWWAHEPVALTDVLEKLQFEGGFIFTWAPDGTARYIFVDSSYSSGDVSATLTQADIGDLKISHTPFTGLKTAREIQYDKHPATGDYQSTYSYSNATARSAYNIQDEENIEQVELDALVESVDDHAAYYGNISGDIKAVVDCSVLRPANWDLTVGDIVQFDPALMPVKAFSDAWTQYFMITATQRRRGSLKITCVEVG